MVSIEKVPNLTVEEKVRFFHLLSSGICLHSRGLALEVGKLPGLRLQQYDAIIEMLHRLFEQSEHYQKRDDAQRPDTALFEELRLLESNAHLHGIISSASAYALRHLSDAK